jgi:phage terminase large subunit GpA-like protein
MQLKGTDYSFELDDKFVEDQDNFLMAGIDMIPTRISPLTISEYSTNRIMPPGSPRPGPWENEFTPYLTETMDNMSPNSPVQREVILKAAQGGWTALAENVICYYMDESPADTLFMSAGDDLLDRWATRRLEPAIDSFGIRGNFVFAGGDVGASKKNADKAFSKDYYGGRLDMASARSASKQRATDKRILIRDEIDGVPAKLATGEGYWLDVSWARTNFWEDRRKVLDFGTPTTYEKSEIWQAYLQGDRRKFYVPCPHCGTFQVLEFGSEKTQHGVKPIRKAGKLVDAVYVCEHCHDPIHNGSKGEMMRQGYWEATARASEEYWVSRHWNSCYSPAMKFRSLYAHYERAREKADGMRSFTNLYLGLPYKETGTRLNTTKLISLKADYNSCVIPDGVIYTTMAADVQKGDADPDSKNPPRIELEVCGHGRDYRTWSINYHRIEGPVNNAYEGAFEDLYQMILRGDLRYRDFMGREFAPVRSMIDSGWNSHVVYAFVQRLRNVFACKGEGLDFKPDETIDRRKRNSDFRFKKSKTVEGGKLYIVATTEYKRIMRNALRVQRDVTASTQPPMFCQFPLDYPPEYFDMLNAEEMMEDGSFDSFGRRNEATDCRVYNMCASESYIVDAVESVRKAYRERGYSERECRAITKDHILTKLERRIANIKVA